MNPAGDRIEELEAGPSPQQVGVFGLDFSNVTRLTPIPVAGKLVASGTSVFHLLSTDHSE